MHRYIIMGPQGSGKGSLARLLSKRLSLVHVSMGEILRSHLADKSDLGVSIDSSMSHGQLVADDVVGKVLVERFGEGDLGPGFILDGFPRTAAQADFFLDRYQVDAVIVLELDDEIAIGRAMNRRLCKSCGADYNLASSPPKVDGVCDDCGSAVVSREDDTPDGIRRRLSQYRSRTAPIVKHLEAQAPVIHIDAAGTLEEGERQILAALKAG